VAGQIDIASPIRAHSTILSDNWLCDQCAGRVLASALLDLDSRVEYWRFQRTQGRMMLVSKWRHLKGLGLLMKETPLSSRICQSLSYPCFFATESLPGLQRLLSSSPNCTNPQVPMGYHPMKLAISEEVELRDQYTQRFDKPLLIG
jgi:hypothetical protein